jgi:myo-inositol-1(or 4)-monophosphatase
LLVTEPTDRALDADLDLIRDAAREAGALAMRYFRRDPQVWMKAGNSPVTEGDLAVDKLLRDRLSAARPDYGWLSEETADSPERLSAARTFVVDPIDGTRGFIAGSEEWCVSVAIVEKGRPVAGVLDCPAKAEIYAARAGGAAVCNGDAIAVREAAGGLRVGGPKALIGAMPEEWRSRFVNVSYIPSLAYRLAMVASGRIDATFIKANSHDWDLAAADLILSEAGGAVLDRQGETPFYAGRETRHGTLVAGSGSLLGEMAQSIHDMENGS